MSVVLSRPYQFIPPHSSDWWPWAIQSLRLIDWHLRKKEGVIGYEVRQIEKLRDCMSSGDGILLAPNHCRYADPIAMGWPAREAGTHLFAMASWHLFNTTSFESFALRRMGAFSVNREGADRTALEYAINVLVEGRRCLLVFPEGTTNRTNDVLKPLLDGVTFIARAAARKRSKQKAGKVVVLPVGMKYLCAEDYRPWAKSELTKLESRIGWRVPAGKSVLQRTIRLAEGMLSLKEIEYLGRSQTGDLRHRRDRLMYALLEQTESKMGLQPDSEDDVRDRVRVIRSESVLRYFKGLSNGVSDSQRQELRNESEDHVVAANLSQDLLSYPDCYLLPGQATDTRIVETIQRTQEAIFGKASDTMPLRVVIEMDDPIEVPADRAPRGETDPVLIELNHRLESMVDRLAKEANPVT